MKRKLVIWGASGHALVIADIIRLRNEYEIVGFLDDVNLQRHGTEFCGAIILGGREQLDDLKRVGVECLIIAFGNCNARLELSKLARIKGFTLVTIIHPNAVIAAGVSIGSGTMIGAGVVIQSKVIIGESTIINSCANISHHCIIEDGCHICPSVSLAGGVRVGSATWVGIGATVKEQINIGKGSVIGAGAVVLDDIPDGVIAYGVPAKVIRKVSIS